MSAVTNPQRISSPRTFQLPQDRSPQEPASPAAKRPGNPLSAEPPLSPEELASLACALRDDWLRYGISTDPADRTRAEAAVTELYGLIGEPRPQFSWVPSPAAALPALSGLPARPALLDGERGFLPSGLRADSAPAQGSGWPVAARLASLMSDLRSRMDARIGARPSQWSWTPTRLQAARAMAPEEALEAGLPLGSVLEAVVHDALSASLRDAFRAPMRSAMLPATGDSLGLAWYGQHGGRLSDPPRTRWYRHRARQVRDPPPARTQPGNNLARRPAGRRLTPMRRQTVRFGR